MSINRDKTSVAKFIMADLNKGEVPNSHDFGGRSSNFPIKVNAANPHYLSFKRLIEPDKDRYERA